MPLLSTDKYGSGPLYDFGSADPNAYLTQGTTYFQTSASGWAIQQDVFDSTFVLAGEIGSNGIGVKVITNDGSRIDVTRTGYLSTDGDAIFVRSTGAFYITNSGTIVSNHYAIVMDDILGSRLLLTNSGTIQAKGNTAIVGSSGVDSILNSGIIIGQIDLGDGSDRIDTHVGVVTDVILGRDGDDQYTIAGTERILEYFGQGNDTVYSYGDFALPDNFETLYLRGSARNAWGNDEANALFASDFDCTLSGRDGNDSLQGLSGDDVLKGGRGNDYLSGGSGDNRLFGGVGDDTLTCDAGETRLDGGAGNDRIFGNAGGTVVIGGDGIDALIYGVSAAGVIVDLAAGTGSGGDAEGDMISEIENVQGSNFADVLSGSNADNQLLGNYGDDRLSGAGGNDVLRGGGGADVLDGGGGVDTVDYSDNLAAVTVDLVAGTGSDGTTIDTLIAIENVLGTSLADTITGSTAANSLVGGGGADLLHGGKGVDTLVGGNGDDTLYGDQGADVLVFADIVVGTPGGWDTDLVYGFENGVDKISFVGASAIHSMKDLVLSVAGADAIISTAVSGDIIRVIGFAGSVDASDFIFAPAATPMRAAHAFAAVTEFAALP